MRAVPSPAIERNGEASPADMDRASAATSSRIELSTLRPGLALLLKAHDYALDAGRDIWDFSVELHRLQAAGLTECELRWLLCKQYVEHALEITLAGQSGRSFRPISSLTFTAASCFVLTRQGAVIAAPPTEHPAKHPLVECKLEPVLNAARFGMSLHWDSDRRELRVNGFLVKRFKLPSANQEAVLSAFEEDGWPPRIDDPLPPIANRDSKRRLHDTINSLNRNQKCKLIRFFGDGNGLGIRWEPLDEAKGPQSSELAQRHQDRA